jgi:hypothetical protein
MAIRRISLIEFSEHNQPSIYSLSGTRERNSTLREAQRIRAEYNDETGQITIYNERAGKRKEEIILHISGVRHIQVYSTGMVPDWEKPAEPAKKGATA